MILKLCVGVQTCRLGTTGLIKVVISHWTLCQWLERIKGSSVGRPQLHLKVQLLHDKALLLLVSTIIRSQVVSLTHILGLWLSVSWRQDSPSNFIYFRAPTSHYILDYIKMEGQALVWITLEKQKMHVSNNSTECSNIRIQGRFSLAWKEPLGYLS